MNKEKKSATEFSRYIEAYTEGELQYDATFQPLCQGQNLIQKDVKLLLT